jgi:hypothetical protein
MRPPISADIRPLVLTRISSNIGKTPDPAECSRSLYRQTTSTFVVQAARVAHRAPARRGIPLGRPSGPKMVGSACASITSAALKSGGTLMDAAQAKSSAMR